MDKEKIRAELNQTLELGFTGFMGQAVNKMLISLVPATEGQPEVLTTLLRAAYDHGAAMGQIAITMALIDTKNS